jgi:hypothetical protein
MTSRKSGASSDVTSEAESGSTTPIAYTDTDQPGAGRPVMVCNRVILYKVKGKKGRKKKKYTRGLKDFQRVAHGITDSSERLSRAFSRGVVRYRRAQNKSARKKRDGGITDFFDNWSKATGRGLRIASRAPYDFVRRVNTKPYTRLVRSSVGLTLSPFFR